LPLSPFLLEPAVNVSSLVSLRLSSTPTALVFVNDELLESFGREGLRAKACAGADGRNCTIIGGWERGSQLLL